MNNDSEDTPDPLAPPTDLDDKEAAETSELEPIEEEEESEEEENSAELLAEIRDEIREDLAASSTEGRRNTRRIFDALKQFGSVLDALSATVNDIHSTARAAQQTPTSSGSASSTALAVIELADRIERISSAISCEPSSPRSWWPFTKHALAPWRADRERLADSFAILSTHMATLLKTSGLERIHCKGLVFEPAYMQATEAVLDSSVADHTVLSEVLPGWREISTGAVVRPAQVRVSRSH